MQRTKTIVPCSLMAVFLISFTMPLWGADKASDEETFRKAAAVLQAMLDSKDVPAGVIAKADCVIVLPSVKKFAVGLGGSGGRGPMSCRGGSGFNGPWSAPAMYTIGGASAGFQIGGTSTDYVLLIMAPAAAQKVINGKVKVGSDATAAAGPGATASTSSADILTYARAKGLFAGVSLSGASLDTDPDANQRVYGKAVSAEEIVHGNAVKIGPAGEALVSVLNSKAAKHTE